jgi:colanic acid/amylovoran biosynthesis glycosyltransferase
MPTIAQCLIWYLPPTMGYIYDQLMALGPERSVVFATEPVAPERFPFERLYFRQAPAPVDVGSSQAMAVAQTFAQLWAPLVREEKVALLHCHDGRIAPAFLSVAHRCDIPIATTFLGRDVSASLRDPGYVQALQTLFKEGDLFTVMSHDMARQVRHLGCPEDKLRVIHHGIPLSRFPFAARQAPETGATILLTAGRLIPKKGPDDLARAFVRLCRRDHDVVLRIAGAGPLQEEMEAVFAEAGVRERVQFLGYLTPEQVAQEMEHAHLFCLPSRVGPDGDSEGIPNVLKEAMATGLPVVSTYHAGIPELVEDGVSGYLVSERDVEALTDRLEQLLKEPERWEAMGRAGRAVVEAEFSLDAAARQLEAEVYTPLLGGSRLHAEEPPRVPRGAIQTDSAPAAGGVGRRQVSIVVPAYNGRRYLAQTLDRVLTQTFSDWELVIVDDGSTDATAAVAEEYAKRDPRVRVVRQANTGVAGARNRGFAETRADFPYVIFVDQDDLWEEDALERLLHTLEAHPAAVAAHGLSRFIDRYGGLTLPGELEVWGRHRMGVTGNRLVSWPAEAPTTLAVLAYRNYIATTGQTLIRRAALEAVGPYDPLTTPCDDWDLTLRLSLRGDLAYLDLVVLNKRRHDTNQSAQREPVLEKARYVRCKLLRSDGLTDEQYRTALFANAHWSRYLCSDRLTWAKRSLAHGEFRHAAIMFGRSLAGHIQWLRGLPA